MEFLDVIKSRKSVRQYLDKLVSQDQIDYIFNCGRLAPSWMNKQCWHFIIIKNQEKIKEIAKTDIINRWLKKVPIIIVACADPLESGKNNNIDYSIVDVTIAFEHIILAATDIGLGTCWIGGFDELKVKEILEIPPRIKIIGMSPLGFPANRESIMNKSKRKIIRSTKRKSLREILHYDIW